MKQPCAMARGSLDGAGERLLESADPDDLAGRAPRRGGSVPTPGLTSSALEDVQSVVARFLETEPMPASSNRSVLEEAFVALARGDGRPFADAMAEDFSWTIAGHGPWARTWRGRDEVRRGLLAPLFAQFAGTYRNRATRIVCEGDVAVVECRGDVATRAGRRYDNHYCYVIDMREGKMRALTEYMDTALAEALLSPPPA